MAWNTPPSNRININLNGAAQENPGLGGASYILRDEQSRWLMGASRNLDTVGAELWGALQGLILAWDSGY